MTLKETGQLLAILTVLYPTFGSSELAIIAWQALLADIPYQDALDAVHVHACTSKYPPTPAEIRRAAVKLPEELGYTPAEAWQIIKLAVSKYGQAGEKDAAENLPGPVKDAVAYLGWEHICSGNEETIEKEFREVYSQCLKQAIDKALVPRKNMLAALKTKQITAGER